MKRSNFPQVKLSRHLPAIVIGLIALLAIVTFNGLLEPPAQAAPNLNDLCTLYPSDGIVSGNVKGDSNSCSANLGPNIGSAAGSSSIIKETSPSAAQGFISGDRGNYANNNSITGFGDGGFEASGTNNDNTHYYTIEFSCGLYFFSAQLFSVPTSGYDGQVRQLASQVDQELKALNACAGGASSNNQLFITNFSVNSNPVDFHESLTIHVQVTGKQNNKIVDQKQLSGVSIGLLYHGRYLGSGYTDANGILDLEYRLPDEDITLTPPGISSQTLSVTATKDNFQEAKKDITIQVKRLLKLLPEASTVPHSVLSGDTVTVKGTVSAVENSLIMGRVANVEIKIWLNKGQNFLTTTSSEDGTFSISNVQVIALDDGADLQVEAMSPDPNAYEDNGKYDVDVDVKTKGKLLVTVATDKAIYNQGEPVTFRGTLTSDGKPVEGSIDAYSEAVIDARSLNKGPIATNPDGSYEFTFIPGSEPGRKELLLPGVQPIIVHAVAAGYASATSINYYLIPNDADTCKPLEILVENIYGKTGLIPIHGEFFAPISLTSKFSQGFIVETNNSARLLMLFDLGGGATASVAMNGGTHVAVARYCKDESGNVQAVLVVDKPGQVLVNMNNPQGTTASYNFKIVTPVVTVKSSKTEYFIGVENDGTTTVVALKDTALVGDTNDANTIELPAINELTIRPGEVPNSSNIMPVIGQIDPGLEGMTTPATPTVSKKCSGTQPYLYVADRTMDTGKTVEIPIMMCNADNLANMDLTLNYDTSVLKIKDITKGSLNSLAIFDWNEVSPGRIKISFASKEGASGSGSIAVMLFNVIGNTGTTGTNSGTVTTAGKPDGTPITVNVNPGIITVGTPPVKGDCNGEGALTERDALAALQMSVEKRPVDLCYDYNKDGKVDSSDAREMLEAIVSGG